MSTRIFDGILFSAAAPQIWTDAGNFHVAYTVRGIHAEFVLPPSTFLKALRVATEVAAKWQVEQLGVVERLE